MALKSNTGSACFMLQQGHTSQSLSLHLRPANGICKRKALSLRMQEQDYQEKGTKYWTSWKQTRQASVSPGMRLQSSDMFVSPSTPRGPPATPAVAKINGQSGGAHDGAVMAAALAAGAGMLAWAVEQGGTYCVVELLMKATASDSLGHLMEVMAAWANAAQWQGMIMAAGAAIVLQLLPLCNGILLMMMLGSIFGTMKGIAVASVAATTSALICMVTGRNLLRESYADNQPALMKAVGTSIASSDTKSLLIVTLFRLSPVVPFCFSNYLFGLTEVRVLPYVIGTWIGTLPATAAFVGAGTFAKNIADGSASMPSSLMAVGCAATLAVLVTIGQISQQELNKMADHDDASASPNTSP